MANPVKKTAAAAKKTAAKTGKAASEKKPTAKKPAASKKAAASPKSKPVTAGDRYRMICERAYYIAEQDGFQPGQELRYWLQAEREIIAQLGH